MKNRSKRSGFSLVELMFSVALLGVFFLGIGTFFLRGNKAAAKGTWRTHVIKRMRTGIKLIQTALNKTSYPSYTSDNSFVEMKPWDANADQYYVTFGKAFTKDSEDFVDFNAEDYVGDILTVTAVTPHQDFSSGAQTGISTVYRFFFPPTATETEIKVPNSDGVVDSRGDAFTDGVHLISLYYEIQTGTVTYNAGGSFTMGPLTTYMSARPLIPNVNRMSVKVFRKTQNHEYSLSPPAGNTYEDDYPKITLQLELECRDPLDGRLVVSQNLIYMINTHVKGS
ncbi:MAG: prepilin-type N-terminal cleavage/methylation domain-containing protein [Candidatus Cloacimonetes bacterium]|nr:prepilin-type N-terminal cleavage/methylation domain-containing protein [Candidatus Cloacimonadota bacterium]